MYVLFPSSTSSTYIALQPLGVFVLSRHLPHALIYTVFDIMVEKL